MQLHDGPGQYIAIIITPEVQCMYFVQSAAQSTGSMELILCVEHQPEEAGSD